MATYDFVDTMCAISGPNGNINLGFGAAVAEGGITIVPVEDAVTMVIGADGEGQLNVHAGKGGTITVRLLKTSPQNAALQDMYNRDIAGGSASAGRNVISLRDLARGDVITCEQVAFSRPPDLTYAKDAGEMAWTFLAVKVNRVLGAGLAVAA